MTRPDGTVPDDILSTITPAQRVPSIGHQLSAFAGPTVPDACHCVTPHKPEPARAYGPAVMWCRACAGIIPARPATTPRPERLTLWDQSAELWSE